MKNFWKRLGSAGVATALCLGMAQGSAGGCGICCGSAVLCGV